MHLQELPTNAFVNIISFLDCKYQINILRNLYQPTKFYLANKKLYKLYKKYDRKCENICYKSIQFCECYMKYLHKYHILLCDRMITRKKTIKILKDAEYRLNYEGEVNSIHFQNNDQFDLAFPYLIDFGSIHHYCCNGLGVSYCRFCVDKPIDQRFRYLED